VPSHDDEYAADIRTASTQVRNFHSLNSVGAPDRLQHPDRLLLADRRFPGGLPEGDERRPALEEALVNKHYRRVFDEILQPGWLAFDGPLFALDQRAKEPLYFCLVLVSAAIGSLIAGLRSTGITTLRDVTLGARRGVRGLYPDARRQLRFRVRSGSRADRRAQSLHRGGGRLPGGPVQRPRVRPARRRGQEAGAGGCNADHRASGRTAGSRARRRGGRHQPRAAVAALGAARNALETAAAKAKSNDPEAPQALSAALSAFRTVEAEVKKQYPSAPSRTGEGEDSRPAPVRGDGRGAPEGSETGLGRTGSPTAA
jgi:hypothetical protein